MKDAFLSVLTSHVEDISNLTASFVRIQKRATLDRLFDPDDFSWYYADLDLVGDQIQRQPHYRLTNRCMQGLPPGKLLFVRFPRELFELSVPTLHAFPQLHQAICEFSDLLQKYTAYRPRGQCSSSFAHRFSSCPDTAYTIQLDKPVHPWNTEVYSEISYILRYLTHTECKPVEAAPKFLASLLFALRANAVQHHPLKKKRGKKLQLEF